MNLAYFVTTFLNKSLANGSASLSSRQLLNRYTDLSQFSTEKQKVHHELSSMYLLLCSSEENKSYRFGGSVNDNIFTILVMYLFKFCRLQNVKQHRVSFYV